MHRKRAPFVTVAILVASVGMAGCVENFPDVSLPAGFIPASLSYTANETTMSLDILDIQSILDGFTNHRPAYKIESRSENRIYWLDGAFNVVRFDHPCEASMNDGCGYDHAQWTRAPPPLGLFWPRLVQGGHGAQLGIDIVQDEPLILSDGQHQAEYHEGAPYPMVWATVGPGYEFRLTQEGPPIALQRIPPWPEIAAGKAGDRDSVLFPGADRPYFGSRVSPEFLFDELLKRQPTVQRLVDEGGCAVSTLYFQSGGLRSPLYDIEETRHNGTKGVFTVLRSDGGLEDWTVHYRERWPTEDEVYIAGPEDRGSSNAICDSLAGAKAPIIDAQEAIQRASSFPIDRSDKVSLHHSLLGDPSNDALRDEYAILFLPANFTTGMASHYMVVYDGPSGSLSWVSLPRSDMERIDGR